MNISELSIRRPVLATVLTIIILLFGLIGYNTLGVREYPSVDNPIISVSCSYSGANADVIENQITEPLEQNINGIPGIRSLSSVSQQGQCRITVEFELSVDLETAANDVRDKVSRAQRYLPRDCDPPTVSKADADATPILMVAIQSDSRSLLELSEIADLTVKEQLQTISDVSSVSIWGEKRYSMRLWLDPTKMAGYGITPVDVKNAITNENIELPSGSIEGNTVELTLRTMGQMHTAKEFNNIILKEVGGRVVRFSDIGYAELGPADIKSYMKMNGVPMVGVVVIPQPGANHIEIADAVYQRMEQMKKEPFKTVFIHGLVRDDKGRKMSKSLGNGIDPLEMAEKYGADALRFNLITGNSPGNDMRFYVEKCEAMRNFCNKIWNASRFIQMNLTIDKDKTVELPSDLAIEDKWIISKFNTLVADVTRNIDQYELGLAAAKLNDFIWENFCDWYIEICKTRLNGEDAAAADAARKVLVYVLDKALKLLHPFMPFITEEIYQALPGSAETIMNEKWPGDENMKVWAEDCADFEKLMDYIKAVRAMRAEMNVHPAKKTSMVIETASPAAFEKGGAYLARFAFATDVTVTAKYEGSTDGMVNVATPDAKGFIPMRGLIDRDKELARLNKELTKAEKELGMFTNQLNNPKFVEKAPAKLVEETRAKLAAAQDKAAKIKESIAALG